MKTFLAGLAAAGMIFAASAAMAADTTNSSPGEGKTPGITPATKGENPTASQTGQPDAGASAGKTTSSDPSLAGPTNPKPE
jgi:hypothetical protein